MALTITISGAVETTTGSTAPAVLTVGVGAPGQGVPAGGTSGQVLQKLSGVSYDTGWLTLPADFITSVTAPLAVGSGVLSVDLTAYSTTAQAAALYYPLSGNPSAFLTASALTPYATIASPTFTGVVTIPSGALISGYLTTADAATSYYPLSGNPSSFLVAADIAGKANIASPALTGNVTITTNSTSPALFIEQSGTGNILTLHDQASDTTFVAIDQNGKVLTIPSTTANAGFNVPHGVAPTTPVNGDIFTTTGGLFARINAVTQQYPALGATNTFTGTNTFSGATVSFGTSTAASTINVGTGATLTATIKAVNIGTAGVAGSTTNIAIGSATGTSTTTLQGATNGVTAAVDTNTTALATTAYVVGNGYAKLASPTFTGTPTLPTGTTAITQSPGNNTTALATTAFVTAAVPAFATVQQASQLSSATLGISPRSLLGTILADNGVLRPISSAFVAANSGSGASASLYYAALIANTPINLVAGYGGAYFGVQATSPSSSLNSNQLIWTKPLGFTCFLNRDNSTIPAGATARMTLGKSASGGTLTTKGVGLDIVGGGSYIQILAHDGTTLTTTNSTYAISSLGTGFVKQLAVISNGSGTAELFVDGVSYGTSSGAPTATGTVGQNRLSLEFYGDGTQAASTGVIYFAPKIITAL